MKKLDPKTRAKIRVFISALQVASALVSLIGAVNRATVVAEKEVV